MRWLYAIVRESEPDATLGDLAYEVGWARERRTPQRELMREVYEKFDQYLSSIFLAEYSAIACYSMAGFCYQEFKDIEKAACLLESAISEAGKIDDDEFIFSIIPGDFGLMPKKDFVKGCRAQLRMMRG